MPHVQILSAGFSSLKMFANIIIVHTISFVFFGGGCCLKRINILFLLDTNFLSASDSKLSFHKSLCAL